MVEIIGCPIATSMGVLGRKWAMVVMRDVVMMGHDRFSHFLHANAGLTPRVLSRRLADLVDAGYLVRTERDGGARYAPSPRGHALAPVLMAMAEFGSMQHADRVYADGKPRTLEEFRAATA